MRPNGTVAPSFSKLIGIVATGIILDIGIDQTRVQGVAANAIGRMLKSNALTEYLYARPWQYRKPRHREFRAARQPRTYSQ